VFPRDAQQPERALRALEALRWPEVEPSADLPLPVGRTDAPGRAAWRRGVEKALEAFEAKTLEKVVLARRARYDFDEPLDPFALARSLEAATPSCFHFLFQPQPGVAFLGASPERLFRRDGQRLLSEAVAGTRPRGASDAADARLREELKMSDKDQREHGFVREEIREVLTPFCESVEVDAETSDMTLARGRHLYAGISAALKPGVRTLDVLRALHPTPAVGGTPTPEARAMIGAVEPFDRGWYAGPVGWIGREAAEFAVGIRSGLVHQEEEAATLSLYSGAGIVRGSSPEAEWAEIEHKISDFARVLALDA
jgi:menaquinone-specific isochorismate synthase